MVHTITSSGWDYACETIDGCCLPCTIGSKQAEEFVLLNVEP